MAIIALAVNLTIRAICAYGRFVAMAWSHGVAQMAGQAGSRLMCFSA